MARGRGRAPQREQGGRGRSQRHEDTSAGYSGSRQAVHGGGRGRGNMNRAGDRHGGPPAQSGRERLDTGRQRGAVAGGAVVFRAESGGGGGGGSGRGFADRGGSSGRGSGRGGGSCGFAPGPSGGRGRGIPGSSPGPGLAAAGGGRGGRGGRTPQAAGGPPALPSVFGLANQYVFVELEKDGVWKVCIPDGQRFGKPFLAGVEVWANQVLSGQAPVLHRLQAGHHHHTTTPAVAGTPSHAPRSTPGGFGVPPPPRPPPPPQAGTPSAGGGAGGSAAAVLSGSSLAGRGLPGLDTLQQTAAASTSRGGQAGTHESAGSRGGSGGGASAGSGEGCDGGGDGGGGLDFVSMLQAQLGIAPSSSQPPPQQPSSGKTKGRRAGQGPTAATPTLAPSLAQDNFKSINGQEAAGAAAEEGYRGLLASLGESEEEEEEEEEEAVDDDGNHQPTQTPYEPYDHEDLELEGEEEEEGEAEEGKVFEYGQQEEEAAYGEMDEEESEEGTFDEGLDDYEYEDEESEDEEDDETDLDEDEEEGEETENEDEDDSQLDSMTDFEDEFDQHDIHIQYDSNGRDADVAATPSRRQQPGRAAEAAAVTPPPPPPRTPATPGYDKAAPSPYTSGPAAATCSLPLTRERMVQWRCLDDRGRLRVSFRLERQALTDTELDLLADWYQERAACRLELTKLWLFDNRIGDAGAAAVARSLLHPGLLELHLSHNVIGDEGAAALAAALPAERPAGLRPLWLRLEWNIINVDLLQQRLEEQRRDRGLTTDIPRVEPAQGGGSPPGRKPGQATPQHQNQNQHQHQLMLVLERGVTAAVRLPWITCQKQAPSEAGVLKAVKGFYAADAGPAAAAPAAAAEAARGAGAQRAAAAAPPPATAREGAAAAAAAAEAVTRVAPVVAEAATTKTAAAPAASASVTTIPPPPPPPPVAPTSTPPSYAAAAAKSIAAGASSAAGASTFAPGPLLLFPDTSALLQMLGGNTALGAGGGGRGGGGGNGDLGTGRPPLDWSLLVELAARGKFGRNLPLNDQVFIVVSDSVMKQMDGLKSVPDTRVAVRRFMSEGLEQGGPAGYDFLTVLGAHEGEGLAAAGGLLGAAGSRSPWLSSKGQAVDLRIVEVALFYQQEVTRAYQQSGATGSTSTSTGTGSPSFLPVILLSNDNAQISAAKSHGLPAFRLSSATDLPAKLDALAASGGALTSGVLRQLMAPQATLALGTTATRSLQDEYDAAVGTLRGVLGALTALLPALERVRTLAGAGAEGVKEAAAETEGVKEAEQESGATAVEALRTIRSILDGDAVCGSGNGEDAPRGVVSGVSALVRGLEAELVGMEEVVRSHQGPSRLVQWAALGGGAGGRAQ